MSDSDSVFSRFSFVNSVSLQNWQLHHSSHDGAVDLYRQFYVDYLIDVFCICEHGFIYYDFFCI